LRSGHTEASQLILFGVASLLVPHHHDRPPLQAGRSTDDSRVVREQPITVQLDELAEPEPDVIKRIRPLRMPRQLHPLPGPALGRISLLESHLPIRRGWGRGWGLARL